MLGIIYCLFSLFILTVYCQGEEIRHLVSSAKSVRLALLSKGSSNNGSLIGSLQQKEHSYDIFYTSEMSSTRRFLRTENWEYLSLSCKALNV